MAGDAAESGMRRRILVLALTASLNFTFYFRYTNTQGNADSQFVFGSPPWLPVSGVFGID